LERDLERVNLWRFAMEEQREHEGEYQKLWSFESP